MVATLKMNTLKEIIKDHAPMAPDILKMGIAGSFARGEDYSENSDIDIIIYTNNRNFDKETLWVMKRISKILMDQFRKEVDFIGYHTIVERKDTPNKMYNQQGYEQMFMDMVWLWEKKNELYQ